MITQERLKELVDYNPETGVFTSKVKRGNSIWPGKVLGSKDSYGYIQFMLEGRMYRAHRLAWLFMYNEEPEIIDHIDRNKSNNKISNLRPATKEENAQNVELIKTNKSGVRGVSWSSARECWTASIYVNGASEFLGEFDTLEEAAEARREAEKEFGIVERI